MKGESRGRCARAASTPRAIARGVLFAALALCVRPVHGQYLTRPQLPWQTIETAHFVFHFPSAMRDWTKSVAQRMESVALSVNAVVGHTPSGRVTVLVEDPSGDSNGFALPLLEGPVIFMWPTPPPPSNPSFEGDLGWGALLAVHEYSHIAHLTIPTRNSAERRLWQFLPTRVGPVARKSPAWVIEGYATLVEGKLTGSGRPHSVGRAAILREWALEGKLPTYEQLDGTSRFLGGNMRYLVGSAFLEWLEGLKGDSSLPHVWRRMSARQQRPFATAFAGVFGASPEDMYGKFVVDLMGKALDTRQRLTEAGLVEGELLQKLVRSTGEPAISPDGKLMALVVRSAVAPSRLVVWKTDEPPDTTIARARARLLARDPLDVPAIDSFPRPRRAVATLLPVSGRSHELPRWMPDGEQLLVSRNEPAGYGAARPDLFLWNYKTGRVRRITRGAGIQQGDPSNDGKEAVAARCADGACALVLVNLGSGAWRALTHPSIDTVWYRPRWSPDGTRIAVSVQTGGKWSVAIVDARTGGAQRIDREDGASRYAPDWATSETLVVVSELGGIANLESIDANGLTVPLTRVIGSAGAPDVSLADKRVYFLTLHAKGYDLRRLPLATSGIGNVVALDDHLAPIAPVPGTPGRPFDSAPAVQSHSYGLGPRRWRLLPGGTADANGAIASLVITNIDPIARLTVVMQGGFGEPATWRGGGIQAALRKLPFDLVGSAWYTDRRTGGQPLRNTGGGALLQLAREQSRTAYVLRAGASGGALSGAADGGRTMLVSEARGRISLSAGDRYVSLLTGGNVSVGQTGGARWTRSLGTADLRAALGGIGARATATIGRVTEPRGVTRTAAYEQFIIGGSEHPYADRLFFTQIVALPGVPAGFLTGHELESYRVELLGFFAEPFATWVHVPGSGTKRLVGLEESIATPTLGFARLPSARIRGGASWSIDAPYRHRARIYAGVLFSP